MADLRLTGNRLAAVRALAENSVTRAALWRVVSADFHLSELVALPPNGRGLVEELPRPLRGAAPRRWGETLAEPPPVTAGSGGELQRAYRDGTTTPREVLDRLLAREDARDFGPSTFSPFVSLDRDRAQEAADASTQRWRRGESRGPLDGVPVPVKDEFLMQGLPTRGGGLWLDAIALQDAFIVTRLREAGAILPGKAHATENGMNPLGFNANFDFPRNVFSAGRGAGGSSTGSAVAVGLGMAPVAVSSDGGGSIRVPAAMNGLFGIKPTLTRFSRSGDIWRGTMGHAGPIGRSTADLVDLLETCSAFDPDDPFTHFATDWDEVRPTWRQALRRSIRGCRVGVLRSELADADPAIARACEQALQAIEQEGATLVDVNIPLLGVANAVGHLVIAGESAANGSDDLERYRAVMSDEVRLVFALMKCVSAQEHLRALRTRTRLREVVAEAMANVDLLALPTHARLAAPYALSEGRMQIADTGWTAAMTRFNFLANLTGLPAASVPIGMADGLPMGLQLVGDAWDEASVLAGCAAFERLEVTRLPRSPGFRSLLAS